MTEPRSEHRAYVHTTESYATPEEGIEEVVYTLISHTPGVGMISRMLEVRHWHRKVKDNKFAGRWASEQSAEPRFLRIPVVSYRGWVDQALRVGDTPPRPAALFEPYTAEEVKAAYDDELRGAEEAEVMHGISVADLPGYNPGSGRPGWDPEGFIRMVEMHRWEGDRESIDNADDLGRE